MINTNKKLVFISCTECYLKPPRETIGNIYIGKVSMGIVSFHWGKLNISQCYPDVFYPMGYNKSYTITEAKNYSQISSWFHGKHNFTRVKLNVSQCYSNVFCPTGCNKIYKIKEEKSSYPQVSSWFDDDSKNTNQKKINFDQKAVLIFGITIGMISTLMLVCLWKKCSSSLINRKNRSPYNGVRPFTVI